jgi:hypothetical protein
MKVSLDKLKKKKIKAKSSKLDKVKSIKSKLPVKKGVPPIDSNGDEDGD